MPKSRLASPQEGEVIKQRRVALGMTQDELGKALGVTTTTISRWERGDTPVASWIMLDKALRYEEMSKIGKITKTPCPETGIL